MALAGPNRKPALVAAASKISYSRSAASKLKELPWQDRAWQVYEAEGSIYFMTRYRSAIARKIDYYAAIALEHGDDPDADVILNDEGEVTGLGEAAKVLEAEGGPELLRRVVSELMVHWDVPGEGYLTRFDEEPFWRVLSTQELKKSGDTYSWMSDNEGRATGSIDPDGVYRVWKPHPRFHWQADSPTKHVLEDAEELILLRRELKARSQSRLPAGAWVLPDSVDFTPFGQDQDGTEDDFARELTNHMSQAVADAGSAAAQVPWILTVPAQDHALVVNGFMNFHRDWEVPMEQREALLRSIATGLDVPPEILTGMADLNHWSAWLVSEQAVSQHVAPTVDDILDSLTTNWFRPLLEAASVDPDKYVLWRDLSPATVPPDRTITALEMFKEGIITDVAVRRVSDFDEEDAPEEPEGGVPPMDADELLKRINALGQLRRAGADWESANAAVGLPPIELIPGLLPITVRAEEVVKNEEPVIASIPEWDWFIQEVAKRLKEGDPPLGEAAVTAAVARRVDAKPLADIDRELLAWLVEETQREIDRLLGVVEKTLTAATDPLDESLLERFRSRVDEKIAEAQAAARQWVENLTGVATEFEDEEQTRGIGLDLIIGGVIEAIRRRLFTPKATPDPIDLGQLPDTLPPIDVLRRGLSVAGGGEPRFDDQATIDMIGNGQRIHDELSGNGFRPELFRWNTGTPSHPFDPHQRLEGVEFDSWDSPKLAVTLDGQWISGSHYRPNDHNGCQCSVSQILVGPPAEIGDQGPGEIFETTGGEENIYTDGMSPEEAQLFMAARRRLIEKYPDAARSVKTWGTGEDAPSRTRIRQMLVEDRDFWAGKGGMDHPNTEQLSTAIQWLDEGRPFYNVYAKGYGEGINGIHIRNPDGTGHLVIRPGLGTDPVPDRISSKVHGTDLPAVQYTTIHEFGHAVEWDIQHRLGDRTPIGADDVDIAGARTLRDAIVRLGYNSAKVSEYATTNAVEGFAETFVAYETRQTGGAVMGNLLDLAEMAESWPTWHSRAEPLMKMNDWFDLTNVFGRLIEWTGSGIFEP